MLGADIDYRVKVVFQQIGKCVFTVTGCRVIMAVSVLVSSFLVFIVAFAYTAKSAFAYDVPIVDQKNDSGRALLSQSGADQIGTINGDTATSTPGASLADIKPGRQLLKGGVEHAEQLSSLEDNLKPGTVFTDDALLQGGTQTNNMWFQIPSWYAGTRHCDYMMIVYRHDFKTGETTSPMQRQLERQDSTSGFRRDRNGGIWDYKYVPQIQHVESDLVNAVLYVKSISPLGLTDDQFVVKYNEVSISLSKKNGKILDVTQQEQISTVTCPQPGILRVDVSVKSFGWDGQPVRLEQSVAFSQITKPFEQQDTFHGQDLRPLFRDFLIANHMENLVPDDCK